MEIGAQNWRGVAIVTERRLVSLMHKALSPSHSDLPKPSLTFHLRLPGDRLVIA